MALRLVVVANTEPSIKVTLDQFNKEVIEDIMEAQRAAAARSSAARGSSSDWRSISAPRQRGD